MTVPSPSAAVQPSPVGCGHGDGMRPSGRTGAAAFALVLASTLSAAAEAPVIGLHTDLSSLSEAELRAALDALRRVEAAPRVGILGVASGFGLARGEVVVAGALTDRRDRGRRGDWDGSVALAAGVGRIGPVGATALVTITSVTPAKFGASGTVGLAFDTAIPSGPATVAGAAVAVGNLVRWGDSAGLPVTVNAALSAARGFTIGGRPVTALATLGWGTGIADLGRRPGAFAGIGIGLSPRLAVSAAWAGDEAILGLTGWFGPEGAGQVSIGLADVTNVQNGQRFLFSVGWRFDSLLSGRPSGV